MSIDLHNTLDSLDFKQNKYKIKEVNLFYDVLFHQKKTLK